MHHCGIVFRHQAAGHERRERGNETRGMAARHTDARGLPNQLPLAAVQLGKAVHEIRAHAVRATGIDQARARVLDHARRFTRGRVRQTSNHEVDLIDQRLSRIGILALLGGQLTELDVSVRLQALLDLQTRGAFPTVDEDLVHGHSREAEDVRQSRQPRQPHANTSAYKELLPET